ncbi:MAG: thiamine diphosphokinase [Smithella sp.]|nr:thiamine diphosphokinase [Smithella sp.]
MAFLFGIAMNKDIVIISGGRLGNPDFFRKSLKEIDNRLLICCDGGARHLGASGFLPDVIVGDMDSIDPLQKAHYEHQGVEMIRHPANKDFTDTALALEYALSMKPRSIQIWGALGGRMDHAMANVYLLIRGKRSGVKTCLLDEFCEVFVAPADVRFENAVGCVVSLLALSPQVEGITLRGFAYPLTDGVLTLSESRGVSNVILEDPAVMRVRSGDLLVIRYRQKNVFPEEC